MRDPEKGDTVCWRRRTVPRYRVYGLVEFVDDDGIHVVLASSDHVSHLRQTITPDRIVGCWEGREMFVRMGGHYTVR